MAITLERTPEASPEPLAPVPTPEPIGPQHATLDFSISGRRPGQPEEGAPPEAAVAPAEGPQAAVVEDAAPVTAGVGKDLQQPEGEREGGQPLAPSNGDAPPQTAPTGGATHPLNPTTPPARSWADVRRDDEEQMRAQNLRERRAKELAQQERARKDLENARSMILDIKKVDEYVPYMAGWARELKDPDGVRMQMASLKYLASYYNLSDDVIHKNFELFQRLYAKSRWGEERKLDPRAFYTRLGGDVKTEVEQEGALKEAYAEGQRMAMTGEGPRFHAFRTWNSVARTKPGYTPMAADVFTHAYDMTQKVIGPHRKAIHDFVAEAANELGDKEADALLERLMNMTPEVRRIVLSASWERAKQVGEGEKGRKGWWWQAASSLGRFATSDTSFEEGSIGNVVDSPGLVTTAIPSIKTLEDAQAYVEEQAGHNRAQTFAAVSSSGTAPVGYIPISNAVSRQMSAEEAALVAQAKERAFLKIDVKREIRAMTHTASPNDSVTASTVGTSAGIAAVMMATRGAGAPILWQYYTANNYEQLRLDYPGMSREDARHIAFVAGGLEVIPDMLNVKVLSAMPSVKALLEGGLKRELVKRALVRGGLTMVYENLQEGVQDITLPAVQSLFAALQQDIPGVKWMGEGGEWERYFKERPKVAIGLLPLMLLGFGEATAHDVANSRAILADDVQLGSVGLQGEDRVRIISLAREGRVEEAHAALKEAWQRRSPEIAAPFQKQLEQQQVAGGTDPGAGNGPVTSYEELSNDQHVLREDGSVDPAKAVLRDRASALRELANGKPAADLNDLQLASIGLARDAQNPDVVVPAPGANAAAPAVTFDNGKPVIHEAALAELQQVYPVTVKEIRDSGAQTFGAKVEGASAATGDATTASPMQSINPADNQPANTRTMGQPIKVAAAERDFLNGYASTLPKDKDGKAPTLTPVTRPRGVATDSLATLLAKTFGREVGWFEGPENHSGTLDPKTGKIWLNAKSPESFATGIVADEGMHWMKVAHPDVYQKVLDHFQGLIKDNKVDPAFGKWLEERGYDFTAKGADGKPMLGVDGKPVIESARMNEEMLGQLGRDMMKDPQFWTATFQHNPGLGRRFIAKLRDFVNRSLDKLKGVKTEGGDATSFLQGKEALESMRDNLATAYATMMHRERAAVTAQGFPDDLGWPVGPDGKPIKTAPDIPVTRTAPDGRKRPGERDNPVASQGLSLRAYSDRTESEQAKIDAGLKAYERFQQVTDLWSVTSGDARRAIVEAAKNFKGGETSFRTHVANLFNDPKFVDKPDFGAYLYYHFGAPDADMVNVHGHHITYKEWIEDQADVVKEIHDTLLSVGINPIVGLENLIHAPNVKGQHSTEKLHEMADALRLLKESGADYHQYVNMLNSFGEESRRVGEGASFEADSSTKFPEKNKQKE